MIKLHNWGGDSEAVSVETIFSATKYTPDEFIHYLNLMLYNSVCCFF